VGDLMNSEDCLRKQVNYTALQKLPSSPVLRLLARVDWLSVSTNSHCCTCNCSMRKLSFFLPKHHAIYSMPTLPQTGPLLMRLC
jgi:hypothetical protein